MILMVMSKFILSPLKKIQNVWSVSQFEYNSFVSSILHFYLYIFQHIFNYFLIGIVAM